MECFVPVVTVIVEQFFDCHCFPIKPFDQQGIEGHHAINLIDRGKGLVAGRPLMFAHECMVIFVQPFFDRQNECWENGAVGQGYLFVVLENYVKDYIIVSCVVLMAMLEPIG